MTPQEVPPVRVDVLGPLRLVVDGVAVDVPGPRRRLVLALLALAEGRVVTLDRLLGALAPDDGTAGRPLVQTHVSRLRGHLGAAASRLRAVPDGYVLDAGPDGVDLAQARALLARARTTVAADPDGAFGLLRRALDLWRGPVLADLVDAPVVAAAVEECAQLHRAVTDALVAAGVAAGRADEVVGTAAAAVAEDPLREPAVLLHVRALAAAGRAPEALDVARGHRRRLADETGLDPSPALAALEREIAAGAVGGPVRPAPVVRPTTRLVGRAAQVAALHRLLGPERLVTVVGPGGVGKTRLALEVAQHSRDTTVVHLAPLTEPDGVPHALAGVLGVTVLRGDVLGACAAVLGDRRALLVVDNCEHLLDAVRDAVALLLAACPELTVLATSREPLGLPEEHPFRLTPLPLPAAVPSDVDRLAAVPSVALFLDRAARVRPGLPTDGARLQVVAEIVRRLDGMPLAIELAAGRLTTFTLEDLRDRLDRALDLLAGGRTSTDRRHRTLRATVAWSYDLLDDDAQRLLRRFAVFPDGLGLDDAERLAADVAPSAEPAGLLARLVDASVLDVDFDGGGSDAGGVTPRYRMLDTIRAYGLDRLAAAGEQDAAQEYLLAWADALTARYGPELTTHDEVRANAALRREVANLRAAWRLARRRGDLDTAAAMLVHVYEAVSYRDVLELREWAEELADDPALPGHPLASRVLGTASEAAYHRGDHALAERRAHQGLEYAAGPGERRWCLLPLAVVELARGAYDRCAEHALAAAAETDDPRESVGIAALARAYGGDLDEARRLNALGVAAAASPTMRAWGDYVAGEVEALAGRDDVAEEHYVRAVEGARASGATFVVGVATVGLHALRARGGRVHEALAGYGEVVESFARTGNWPHLWVTLRNLADLLDRLGDHGPATLLRDAAAAAPDAPADGPADGPAPGPAGGPAGPGAGRPADRGAPAVDRAQVLAAARDAVARHRGADAAAAAAAVSGRTAPR